MGLPVARVVKLSILYIVNVVVVNDCGVATSRTVSVAI